MKFILYILKRIIIGVSIVLSVSFIKGLVVNADTISYKYELAPNRINYFYNNDGSVLNYCTSYSTVTLGTYTFNRCLTSSDHVPVSARVLYNGSQFGNVNDTSKNWSVFFSLYLSSDRIRTINSVMVETGGYAYACNVIGNSNPGSQNTSTEAIYGIYCPSVVMHGSNFYITANFDDYSGNTTSGTFYFGPSTFITWVDNNDSTAIVAAINSLRSSITNQSTQAHNDSVATQDKIDDVNNTLNDNSTDNPSSSFESFNNSLPSNNTISNLITLPVQLFQKILNSLSSSCSPFNLGNLMGTDIILPCINIANYIGTTLWNVIDILFSGFFVLVIGRKMIKAFENFSSMKEGDVLND